MLVDLPDYTSANPWQSKTIDTCAPMAVSRRVEGNISTVRFLLKRSPEKVSAQFWHVLQEL